MAKTLQESRKWYNVELTGDSVKRFKGYLLDMHIEFETMQAGESTHYECFMNTLEKAKANEFLALLER